MIAHRAGAALAAAVLGLAATGCSYIPWPGGGGGATSIEEEQRQPPSGSVASPATVSRAFVDAWRLDDRAAADPISETEALRQLFKRRPLTPAPEFVACNTAGMVGGGVECMFSNGRQLFNVLAVPRASGEGWVARSVKFQPMERETAAGG